MGCFLIVAATCTVTILGLTAYIAWIVRDDGTEEE